MYTHFRVGHRRRIKHDLCPKREYLLVGEFKYICGKQLGIRTSQCVMLVPKLTGVDEGSTFPTYILPLDIFFKTPLACSAKLLRYTQSPQDQLPLALLLEQGRRTGAFSLGALSQPWGYWLLLICYSCTR